VECGGKCGVLREVWSVSHHCGAKHVGEYRAEYRAKCLIGVFVLPVVGSVVIAERSVV